MEAQVFLCIKNAPGESIKSLSPGTASGPLTGGNLSLGLWYSALPGAGSPWVCNGPNGGYTARAGASWPWQIDAKDRILYLEDVDEPVYALDRLLSQLHYAGVLQSAAGRRLGQVKGSSSHFRIRFAVGP